MDRLSLFGLVAGLIAVVGTQAVEGADLRLLLQGPAALIVLLGTFGATVLSCGASELQNARHALVQAFLAKRELRWDMPAVFFKMAFIARKDGLVALDRPEAPSISPFGQRAVRGLVDGCDREQLETILTSDVLARRRQLTEGAHVFEIAGGYAPTMGILGAVLGLIHAMEALTDPELLGSGIAVAFIATLYGVGVANLLLLPIATKIRQRARQIELEDEMIIEGILGLQAGIAPRMLERQLNAHLSIEDSA